jgi:hypothetical protein
MRIVLFCFEDITDCIGRFAVRLQSGAFGQSASSSGIAPVWDPDTEADVSDCFLPRFMPLVTWLCADRIANAVK